MAKIQIPHHCKPLSVSAWIDFDEPKIGYVQFSMNGDFYQFALKRGDFERLGNAILIAIRESPPPPRGGRSSKPQSK